MSNKLMELCFSQSVKKLEVNISQFVNCLEFSVNLQSDWMKQLLCKLPDNFSHFINWLILDFDCNIYTSRVAQNVALLFLWHHFVISLSMEYHRASVIIVITINYRCNIKTKYILKCVIYIISTDYQKIDITFLLFI